MEYYYIQEVGDYFEYCDVIDIENDLDTLLRNNLNILENKIAIIKMNEDKTTDLIQSFQNKLDFINFAKERGILPDKIIDSYTKNKYEKDAIKEFKKKIKLDNNIDLNSIKKAIDDYNFNLYTDESVFKAELFDNIKADIVKKLNNELYLYDGRVIADIRNYADEIKYKKGDKVIIYQKSNTYNGYYKIFDSNTEIKKDLIDIMMPKPHEMSIDLTFDNENINYEVNVKCVNEYCVKGTFTLDDLNKRFEDIKKMYGKDFYNNKIKKCCRIYLLENVLEGLSTNDIYKKYNHEIIYDFNELSKYKDIDFFEENCEYNINQEKFEIYEDDLVFNKEEFANFINDYNSGIDYMYNFGDYDESEICNAYDLPDVLTIERTEYVFNDEYHPFYLDKVKFDSEINEFANLDIPIPSDVKKNDNIYSRFYPDTIKDIISEKSEILREAKENKKTDKQEGIDK